MRKNIILGIVILLLVFLTGCNTKTVLSSEEGKPTQIADATKGAAAITDNITEIPEEKAPITVIPENRPDDTADTTPVPVPTTGETSNVVPGVTQSPSGEAEATPEVTEEPREDDEGKTDDGRNFCWEVTYITWLPKFTEGVFDKHTAADTFDYAIFNGVSKEEFKAYIDKLTAKGFDKNITQEERDKEIIYTAQNENEWYVQLKYDGSSLSIGSGFYDEEDEEISTDSRDVLWTTTLLAYIPYYGGGSFESTDETTGQETYSYAVFTGVTEQEARSYIDALIATGYIYEVEQGDTDGVLWYMALSEDKLNCYMSFDKGIMRIGCGYSEEE